LAAQLLIDFVCLFRYYCLITCTLRQMSSSGSQTLVDMGEVLRSVPWFS